MLNKKLLAVSISALMSASVYAVVDTNATSSGTRTVAKEVVSGTGNVAVSNTGNILDVRSDTGFSIPNAATRYIRYDLTGATFGATASASAASTAMVLSQGGTAGDNYAIISVTANATTASTNDITMVAPSYSVAQTGASVTYGLYETAGAAVNKTTPLATSSADLVKFAEGLSGKFTTAGSATATVATGFKNFNPVTSGSSASFGYDTAVNAGIGGLKFDLATIATTAATASGKEYVDLGGNNVDNKDLLGADSNSVSLTGNFTVGTWTAKEGGCSAGSASLPLTVATGSQSATVAITHTTSESWEICVAVPVSTSQNAVVVPKGSYTAAITAAGLSDAAFGKISYDTTSITVPYVTTFSAYNQRIYIKNAGSVDASYTTSFASEDGVTATAGTAATGTVPAGKVLAIKASDLVTLTGKTRTSAVIEIEALASNVTATTQTVNLGDNSTDTVKLDVQ